MVAAAGVVVDEKGKERRIGKGKGGLGIPILRTATSVPE